MNDDQHLHLMKMRANNSYFYTHALLSFNTVAGALYFGGDNLIALLHVEGNVTSRPFPVRILCPFEAEQSPIYELLVVVLFVHSMGIVYTVNIFSSLVFTLVRFAKFFEDSANNLRITSRQTRRSFMCRLRCFQS